jgi:hypothetical protein
VSRLLRNYFFWTYERGSFHYDVMVTLILLFLFVSPRFINFKERPVAAVPLHPSEVLIKEQSTHGDEAIFVYEIRAGDLHGAHSDAQVRAAILNVVEPIAGDVTLEKYAAVRDAKGQVVAYDATVSR